MQSRLGLSVLVLRTRLIIACLLPVSVSCTEAPSTQLVVLMDTDYAVPAEVDRVEARVSKIVPNQDSANAVETWARTFELAEVAGGNAMALPSTFGVVPDDADIDREVIVELRAMAPRRTEPLVSRRIRTEFVRGESRLIRVLLYEACAGVTCDAGQSCGCPDGTACGAPSCHDEFVAAEDLEAIVDPGSLPPNVDFPNPPDGGVGDGGVVCEEPLSRCGGECVDLDDDPLHCGGCDRQCEAGSPCQAGECADPEDCRVNDEGCVGLTYCDAETGQCLEGCARDDQCRIRGQRCDTEAHTCECADGLEPCAEECVNTEDDPRFCGQCSRACDSGDICEQGVCLDPGDCRTNGVGCTGFTYCNEANGECTPGCGDDDQCIGDNELCNTGSHACECIDDYHECDGSCVSDFDVATCGTACEPCEAPAGAAPICDMGTCDFVCETQFEQCDDACCCPLGTVLYENTCASVHVRVLVSDGDVGEYSSLALDDADAVRVAYYARSGRNLFYAAQQPDGSFVEGPIDTMDEPGQYASLAFDPSGVAHVAYHEAKDDTLEYASLRLNGSWDVVTIDDSEDVGRYASLAFDPGGVAHVAYYDRENERLLYASELNDGSWSTETADEDGEVGEYASLAFDSSGAAHIVYYDKGNESLSYATREPNGTWIVEPIDADPKVGKYASLKISAEDVPHVSYYDETNEDLRYATLDDSGAWSVETIDGEADVGTYTSLDLDSTGLVRIAYYDETNRDLMFAFQAGAGAWTIRRVDGPGDVGRFASMALDRAGNAHVSYHNVTTRDLKYALIAAPIEAPP